MVCCIVAAIMVVVIHRLMPWRSRIDDGGFAPMATRGVPGATVGPAVASAPPVTWLDQRIAVVSWTLRFAALAIALYLIGGAALLMTGVASDTGPTVVWLIRSTLLVVAAAMLLRRASRLRRHGCDPLTIPQIVGCAGLGAGATSLVLVVLDVDLAGLYAISAPLVNGALHVVPALAVVVGLLLRFVRALPVRRHRDSVNRAVHRPAPNLGLP